MLWSVSPSIFISHNHLLLLNRRSKQEVSYKDLMIIALSKLLNFNEISVIYCFDCNSKEMCNMEKIHKAHGYSGGTMLYTTMALS